MFTAAWCGEMSVGGWILMGLFWATFLGLVLWALSRLFAGPRGHDGVHDVDDLDQQLARGQIDASEYRTLRDELKPAAIPTPSALQPPARWWRSDAFEKRSMTCPKNPPR
jgi:hypothetical protein